MFGNPPLVYASDQDIVELLMKYGAAIEDVENDKLCFVVETHRKAGLRPAFCSLLLLIPIAASYNCRLFGSVCAWVYM